ncbi:MAG: antibiotic biosynthesis monooxygenase [Ponticaulis sp.]|nr:antibiotic biosynthesis monooxygenase [Ponticaulis sp.]|tara:strand:+ start:27734 stop:28024 length:291 start_codon:yes stop_codon:yes gene_type:complete
MERFMLYLVARLTPRPEVFEETKTSVASIIAPTRKEPGCQRFELHSDDEHLYLVEAWDDEAALDFHYAQPYTSAVMSANEDRLVSSPRIEKMHLVA